MSTTEFRSLPSHLHILRNIQYPCAYIIQQDLSGALNLMLYGARWGGVRPKDARRVMGILVDAWIYKLPAYWYLEKIVAALNLNTDLATLLVNRDRRENDGDIRMFLKLLAVEIEDQYLDVARSGRLVRRSGIWVCTRDPEIRVNLIVNRSLPYIDGDEVIWEYQADRPDDFEEVILNEFALYYPRKLMGQRPSYLEPSLMSPYSVRRLACQIQPKDKRPALFLLHGMHIDRLHPLTGKIAQRTLVDWTKDDNDWAWFQLLIKEIRRGLLKIF